MGAQTFHQLYYHIVWSTKDRVPIIVDEVKAPIIEAVTQACNEREVTPLACNAMPDHIHLFVQLPPAECVAKFIGQIKGASAFAHNRRFGERNPLKWQEGYGVVTVREAESAKVIRYIENQQELHQSRKTSRLLEATEERNPQP